jgi:multidrug transporter EmrE-like cation transporter
MGIIFILLSVINESDRYLYYILILVFFESIAFYCLSKHHQNKNRWFLIVAMLIYGIVVANMISQSLNYGKGIGTVNFTWNCCSTVTAFLIGILFFEEQVSNIQWMGVSLAFVGVSLIVLSKKII